MIHYAITTILILFDLFAFGILFLGAFNEFKQSLYDKFMDWQTALMIVISSYLIFIVIKDLHLLIKGL